MSTPNTIDMIDTHAFDTPRAKAYFADFLEDPTLDYIEDTFEYDSDDLAEASDALYAAELIAALIGNPAKGLPEAVKAACKGKPMPNKKLLAKTRAAVRAALDPQSALYKHWAAAGFEPWHAAVKNLIDRLT